MSLESLFPKLAPAGYALTSPKDPDYNCIAWAAGDDKRWWDWSPGYYWPPNATRTPAVKGAIEAFKALGYEHCPDGSHEPGCDKVAIYSADGNYSHAARQLPTGQWASKIGGLEDIEHDNLTGLDGVEYGSVVYIMKRKTP